MALTRSYRIIPPIKSKEEWKIAKKASQAYLRLRITNCQTQIKKHSQRLSHTAQKLRELINNESYTTLTSLLCSLARSLLRFLLNITLVHNTRSA